MSKKKKWVEEPDKAPRVVFNRDIKPTLKPKSTKPSIFMTIWSLLFTVVLTIFAILSLIPFIVGLGTLSVIPLFLLADRFTRYSKDYLWLILTVISYGLYIGAYLIF